MGKTKIEWAQASWNPITGCTPISEGCNHCYAQRMAIRLRGRYGYPEDGPFRVTAHPDKLDEPTGWLQPKIIFVCSMGDLFHPDVKDEWISSIFETMFWNTHHRFLVLTKRPERMLEIVRRIEAGSACRYLYGDESGAELMCRPFDTEFSNVWLGVTAENQRRADERIHVLLEIPAARRFVSIEPMLGPVDLSQWLGRSGGLDWVICGGETGPGARPVHPDWVRSLRDQCQMAGVPFFFKSWGDWRAFETIDDPIGNGWVGGCYNGDVFYPGLANIDCKGSSKKINMFRVGKKAAGRILDGRTWDDEPK